MLLIESFRRFPVQDITTVIMMAALDTRQRFQLSYWDAAIIEASRAMGCTQVLSEDLSSVRRPQQRPGLWRRPSRQWSRRSLTCRLLAVCAHGGRGTRVPRWPDGTGVHGGAAVGAGESRDRGGERTSGRMP